MNKKKQWNDKPNAWTIIKWIENMEFSSNGEWKKPRSKLLEQKKQKIYNEEDIASLKSAAKEHYIQISNKFIDLDKLLEETIFAIEKDAKEN